MNGKILSAAIVLLAVAAFHTALAQVPRTISYQGFINGPSGEPLSDGPHSFSFRLYSGLTGGPALYSETQSLEVKGGLFSAVIGSTTPIPLTLGFNQPYFLGIAVDGGTELIPRTPLTAAPYALHATTAEVASGLAPEANGVVTSVNGEDGAITLQGGGGTTITKAGKTITISSTGSGGTGIQGVQNTDGTVDITNPNGPVATLGLADDAVTSDKIADGSVTTDHILDGTIIGDDLSNGTLSPDKIDVTGANAGDVLTFDGNDLVFATTDLTLPFVKTVETTDAFSITNNGSGSAGVFSINDSVNSSHALVGKTNGDASWDGPAGVAGLHTGNSGIGVYGYASGPQIQGIPPRGVYGKSDEGVGVYGFSQNGTAMSAQANGNSPAVFGLNIGTGQAGYFQVRNADNSADAVIAATDGSGDALYANTTGTGRAGYLQINNASSNANALLSITNGSGHAILGQRTGTTGTSASIRGEIASTSNGSGLSVGATGVLGIVTSTSAGGWSAGVRGINNSTTGNGIGVIGYQAGSGWGVAGQTESGTGVRAVAGDGGNALVAIYTGTSGSTTTANNIAIFQAPPRTGGAATNRARINSSGVGYFNGGTVNSGADVAELFDIEGPRMQYEPGDVLIISTETDRTVEKSSDPYSTLVVGVYATKPGVLLTEEHIDADFSGKVPMGIVGVIPTKVTDENGAISRGDILVTSSTPGHAMKADSEIAVMNPGCIIGKALQNFDAEGSGVIKVLVNVR